MNQPDFIAVKLDLGTLVGRAGSPLPAAVANQRFLIRLDGAHGVTRPTGRNVAKNCQRTPDLLENKLFNQTAALLALAVWLLAADSGFSGEAPAAEYQVKAIFLLNFAKYVDWPAAAFPNTNTPITIGVLGEDRFDNSLRHAVEGKTVNGRPFIIRNITADAPLGGCHILFISDSEKRRLGEILERIKLLPVLTVGETGQFLEQGGVINFVKKAGKIRLEINLQAARQARLHLSSRLLGVADVVLGKVE